ncbi:glycoside hydrolase family 13 protein [Microbacterium terricola]|uniref:Alpha-glucosidase n=1 Tax=Microbacterium terricola TaxID=344163 RepID=A0ABM8E218_9MICO|nr:glycoside hydrolase family 13 protein [Microbacterium terricola]UYK40290.1 glycoside hydrolase family 13 protein [Microbacterium terricola]BDV31997.1 alpha-glucosidase [Microbacterium terricola]
MDSDARDDALWWRSAVIYQVYVRSFADGNGDGTGDLAGVRQHLGYLKDLGVDAIWFNPWYPSPLADGGYDVQDYRDIDPRFGTLAEAEALITEALALGIRTIIDVVPNHISDQHEWFQAALAAGPGSPERERFWFHPGKGEHGDEIPTHWVSSFQGTTWTRTTDADGTPGEWYLHMFTPEQPDLNWNHPDVRREHEDILRFWFDRGVAGVRIDSAALLVKDADLPEVGEKPDHPTEDRDELHDIYRSWRSIADSYPGTRVLVGEIWVPDIERFTHYLRSDELHTAFNFDFLARPWGAASFRESIEQTLAAHAPVGAPSTWVLSNHDVTRPATRYGREDTAFAFLKKRFGVPSDPELGLHRARAAALLVAALPGSLYIYQGDELGLPEVEDLPRELIQDPMHFRSGGVDPGRDGCRVPLPWSGAEPPYGFGPAGTEPWLPQPADWSTLTVQAQEADPASTLHLYRDALRLRREIPALGDGPLTWWDDAVPAAGHRGAASEILAFRRGDTFACVVNTGDDPVPLPEGTTVLLSSAPLDAGRLAGDSTAWLQVPAPTTTHTPEG